MALFWAFDKNTTRSRNGYLGGYDYGVEMRRYGIRRDLSVKT